MYKAFSLAACSPGKILKFEIKLVKLLKMHWIVHPTITTLFCIILKVCDLIRRTFFWKGAGGGGVVRTGLLSTGLPLWLKSLKEQKAITLRSEESYFCSSRVSSCSVNSLFSSESPFPSSNFSTIPSSCCKFNNITWYELQLWRLKRLLFLQTDKSKKKKRYFGNPFIFQTLAKGEDTILSRPKPAFSISLS